MKKLLQLYVYKRKKEQCSSGISPEHRELDYLPQEIYERKKESEGNYHQQSLKKEKQINKVKKAAEDMQTKSLERLSKTRKRKLRIALQVAIHEMKRDVEAQVVIDTIAYLREKTEKAFQLGEAELKLRRGELELNKSRDTWLCQQIQIPMTV